MRPRQDLCTRGHPLADAHVAQTAHGVKRTCRKCRYLRHRRYIGLGDYPDSGVPNGGGRGAPVRRIGQ